MISAAGTSLYISPGSITKNVGDLFGAFVGFNSSGNKVCAVEGTLVFNNLSCQSITAVGDVMAQSSPTCSNPHFLIGIPNCAVSDKILFILSIKAGSAGMASVGLTGVDIIGEGASLGSASIGGNYTIEAIPVITPMPMITPAPSPTPTPIPTITLTPSPTPVPIATPAQENNLLSNAGTASLMSADIRWFIYPAIVLVVLIILYGIYYFVKKRRK